MTDARKSRRSLDLVEVVALAPPLLVRCPMLNAIDSSVLPAVTGGAGPSAQQQQEFRALAKQYCPATYAANKNAPQITRQMGERCLDEAGYGMFKGQLDRYFPRR